MFFFLTSTARKTKKKIKGIQQATPGVSQETSENPANKTIVPATLPQLTPTLVSLLEVIEPEVLYAGYDSSVPDSTWRIMTTLNMLGGRQVIAAVKWAKAIPGKTRKVQGFILSSVVALWLCHPSPTSCPVFSSSVLGSHQGRGQKAWEWRVCNKTQTLLSAFQMVAQSRVIWGRTRSYQN